MHLPDRIRVSPYLLAVVVTTAAILLRWLLNPILGETLPMLTLYAAVATSSWFGGYRPALLVALAGYGLCNYLFIAPQGSFRLDNTTQVVGFAAYVLTCVIIIWLCESTRAANMRFRQKEAELKRGQEELRQSEQSVRTILESITDSFYTLDHAWRFIYVNPAAERLLERTADKLLGKSLWDEYPDVKGTEVETMLRLVVARHEASTFTAFYAAHNRWYENRAYPAGDGLSVYFRDITESRQAEAALRNSERQRTLALDSAELGYWNLDIATRSIRCDERFCIIFTGMSEPLSNEQAINAIHEEDRERVRQAVAATLNASFAAQTPLAYAEEYRVVHADGQIRWVLARGRPNFANDGHDLVSFDGTVSDITERKQVEQQLQQQSIALAEVDKRKNEFLATLAHELRNPLAPIANSLQVMRLKGNDANTVERMRQVIDRQVTQLARLVDDLLDISRINHDKLELRRDWVDLASVVKSAVESSRPLLESNGLQTTVSLPSEPVYLHADLMRLAQVLLNLLNNAAKFTDRGGEVKLSAEWLDPIQTGGEAGGGHDDGPDDEPNTIAVTVSDTGIGISAEQLPRIFDAFNQVPGSQKRSGGLGIGLMLVQRLVEMHGGTVKAHSDGPGRGCRFTVLLPALRAIPATGMPNLTDGTYALPPPKLRILVVDDNQDAATSLAMMLDLLEHETQIVHHGMAALEAAATYQPQVVLLDIGLPDLSGYEVARRIRMQPWGKSIRLFALTGWGQEEDRRKSQDAGFDAHLVKPVNATNLLTLLAGVDNATLETAPHLA